MSGLTRDYLALYVQMLRWALTQQLDFALSRPGFVTPNVGHRISFKSELLAASSFTVRRAVREKLASPAKRRDLRRVFKERCSGAY